jgi:ribosomal protein S6
MAKEAEMEGAVLEDTGAELRVYELGFHIDPELSTEDVKKTYQDIRDVITKGGEIIAEGEPQKIPLAYTISRSETGGRRDWDNAFFAWIAYETDGAGHTAVAEAAATPRIIRFLDLRTTKDMAKHSAEMREIFLQHAADNAAAAAAEEDVSEVELDAALKEAGV